MTPEQAKSLAQIEQKLNDLCVSNTAEHVELKGTTNDIYKVVDENKSEMYKALNNRPRWSVVMWLIGGVFGCIAIIGTLMWHLDRKLEVHMDNSRAIYQQLTGQPWEGDIQDVEPLRDKEK